MNKKLILPIVLIGLYFLIRKIMPTGSTGSTGTSTTPQQQQK